MNGGGEKGSTTTKTPGDFLKSICGQPVVVKLNSGLDYRGQSPYFLFVKSTNQRKFFLQVFVLHILINRLHYSSVGSYF